MHFSAAIEARLQRVRTQALLMRLVFFSCLAYLVLLVARLPVEDAAEAVARHAAAHEPRTSLCTAADPSSLACLRAHVDQQVARARSNRVEALLVVALLCGVALLAAMHRRKVGAEMHEQLRFNEQLIDAIPLPLSLRSPDGRFLLVNRAFEKRFGIPRDVLLGARVDEALAADAAARIKQMDALAMASPEPQECRFEVRLDDRLRHVQATVSQLRRGNGTLLGLLGVVNDVTALVENERKLTETNAKLSQLSMKMIGAQEDERRRIARDLHDQVGQILTALKLQLSALAKRERIEQPASALLAPLELTEEVLAHTRNLSASLHPHLLDDLGLQPALNWLIDRFIRPSLPQVELRCRIEPARGPAAIELVAFRVVQEALTNVVRHARATRAGVMLETREGWLHVEVIDDGVGFEAGRSWFDLQRSTSVGVTSMHDRVSEAGGELFLESADGHGTSVRALLPWTVEGAR